MGFAWEDITIHDRHQTMVTYEFQNQPSEDLAIIPVIITRHPKNDPILHRVHVYVNEAPI